MRAPATADVVCTASEAKQADVEAAVAAAKARGPHLRRDRLSGPHLRRDLPTSAPGLSGQRCAHAMFVPAACTLHVLVRTRLLYVRMYACVYACIYLYMHGHGYCMDG